MVKDSEELEIEDQEEEDEAPVDYDIATYPSDFTLQIIHKMWHERGIEIPEFQREFVWKIQQSSLLIESFLLGLPVPPVFFYIDEENKNLVIDGQQRILSCVYFFDGYFGEESIHGRRQVFRLAGLDERSPYHNLRYPDLSESDQRKLQNAVLRAINVRQLSPSRENTSIYHIFERLNTGGTALKPQEIRNCVFRGDFAKLIKTLNEDKNWRNIMGKPTKDKHQRDVELVLRVFALSRTWEKYDKPMKEYLNVSMKKNKVASSSDVLRFQDLFPKVCALIVKELGARPFHIRGPLNSSVLDSVFCIVLDNFQNLPKDISDRYRRLIIDQDFLDLTYKSTTDTKVLRSRFKIARSHLVG